ncbi:MAG: hypothetical protein WCI75_11895, partial [candidate division NC10 bacterium]
FLSLVPQVVCPHIKQDIILHHRHYSLLSNRDPHLASGPASFVEHAPLDTQVSSWGMLDGSGLPLVPQLSQG